MELSSSTPQVAREGKGWLVYGYVWKGCGVCVQESEELLREIDDLREIFLP